MSSFNTRGIIIKQSDYGEGHRMLSLFSADRGIIKAVKYGAKSTKNRDSGASQFLCYGDFSLFEGKGDVYTINSISSVDSFFPISEDIKKLSLCVYLADITYALLGLQNPDERILSAFLNCVYAISYRNEDLKKAKAVYEMRLMAFGGYMPRLDVCFCGGNTVCGFDVEKGGVVCPSCKERSALPLSLGTLKALVHICTCPDKKILSFTGNEVLIDELCAICEKYLLCHLDRSFSSLDYYKSMDSLWG